MSQQVRSLYQAGPPPLPVKPPLYSVSSATSHGYEFSMLNSPRPPRGSPVSTYCSRWNSCWGLFHGHAAYYYYVKQQTCNVVSNRAKLDSKVWTRLVGLHRDFLRKIKILQPHIICNENSWAVEIRRGRKFLSWLFQQLSFKMTAHANTADVITSCRIASEVYLYR